MHVGNCVHRSCYSNKRVLCTCEVSHPGKVQLSYHRSPTEFSPGSFIEALICKVHCHVRTSWLYWNGGGRRSLYPQLIIPFYELCLSVVDLFSRKTVSKPSNSEACRPSVEEMADSKRKAPIPSE